MKMKPEHYGQICAAFDVANLDFMRAEYRRVGYSDKRFRWDAFYVARIQGDTSRFICDTLYAYLDDTHVDSALRHYWSSK